MLERGVFQHIMMASGLQRLKDRIEFLRTVPLLADHKISDDQMLKLSDAFDLVGGVDCDYSQCSNEAGVRRFCLKQDHTGSEAEASTRIQELLKIRRCRIEQELLNLIGSFCRKRSSCSIRTFCYTEAPDKKHK